MGNSLVPGAWSFIATPDVLVRYWDERAGCHRLDTHCAFLEARGFKEGTTVEQRINIVQATQSTALGRIMLIGDGNTGGGGGVDPVLRLVEYTYLFRGASRRIYLARDSASHDQLDADTRAHFGLPAEAAETARCVGLLHRAGAPRAVPLCHYWQPRTRDHYYVAGSAPDERVISQGYVSVGVLGYVLPMSSGCDGERSQCAKQDWHARLPAELRSALTENVPRIGYAQGAAEGYSYGEGRWRAPAPTRQQPPPISFVEPDHAPPPADQCEARNRALKRYFATALAPTGWQTVRPGGEAAIIASARQAICATKFDPRDAERDTHIRVAMLGLADLLGSSGVAVELANSSSESDIALLNTLPTSALCVTLRFRELGGLDFEAFATAGPAVQRRWACRIQSQIASALSVPEDEVVVMRAIKGSVKVETIIGQHIIGDKINKSDLATLDSIYATIDERFRKLYAGIFLEADVTLQALATRFKLAPSDFDRRGDFVFPNAKGDTQKRGGHVYHQPNSRWRRLGLRVLGLYDGGDEWISMSGAKGEWMVGFHGTSHGGAAAFEGIARTRVIVPGNGNAYRNEKATNQATGVPPVGIYFANTVESCYRWRTTDPTTRHTYELAFQCRIDPKGAWVPKSNTAYIIARTPVDVHPYGILLCKV
jgi:hypothetical protein